MSDSVVQVELHSLDPKFVPSALRSANGQVLWSAGERAAPELWRYIPGSAEPERLFLSPRGDAVIQDVVAAGPGYAFVETSQEAFGPGGWRIWFLPASGGEPVELDRGEAPGAGAAPTIAMNDTRIVWAAFDEPAAGPVSRLRMVPTNDLAALTTLVEFPVSDGLLWFPDLNGDELWYAIIHPERTGSENEFHIESMSLSDPNSPPTRFAGVGNDFNPAVSDSFIVWKTAEGDSAALNWGSLSVLNRETDAVVSIPVSKANRPSIGDRYVTFDELTHSRLVVFDPITNELLDLRGDLPKNLSVGGQSISGQLLTFFTQTTGFPQIWWATLPN